MIRIGLFEKCGPLDIAYIHCTVRRCKCNFTNCMGSFLMPSYSIRVVGITASCKPYISQEQIFMFYVCPDVIFFHHFVHCSFTWHHRCWNFNFLVQNSRWHLFMIHGLCKCVTNEHMLLSRKHFSHMLTCCMRESTQVV
jgi:hypothetical protein